MECEKPTLTGRLEQAAMLFDEHEKLRTYWRGFSESPGEGLAAAGQQEANGSAQADRIALRQEKSQAVVTPFRHWMERSEACVMPESAIGMVSRCGLNERSKLTAVLEWSGGESDNNRSALLNQP